jgi:hypothetical protein
MYKILVSGASVAWGAGFEDGKDDKNTWPNQLARKLNSHITNISQPGYDNVGIFLKTMRELLLNKYDLILIEIVPINRLILSPNIHEVFEAGWLPSIKESLLQYNFSDKDINTFYKILTLVNHNFEHWRRFLGIIATAQMLVTKGYNIRFVNNHLDWDEHFFNNKESKFANNLIDADNLPDSDINSILGVIEQQKKTIDLNLWINPFKSLIDYRIDDAAPGNWHPGPKSNDIFSDSIINYLINQNLITKKD